MPRGERKKERAEEGGGSYRAVPLELLVGGPLGVKGKAKTQAGYLQGGKNT